MDEWVFLNDGSLEGSLSKDVSERLDNAGLLYSSAGSQGRTVRFTGFLYTKTGWIVVFPKAFRILDDFNANLHASSLLYRVLIKYSRTTDANKLVKNSELFFEQAEDLSKIAALSMYDFLLEDWGKFGPYRNVKRRTVISHAGKINWKKTLSRLDPLVNDEGIPVYNSFITTKNDYGALEQISLLQKWAVATADLMLGWLIASSNNGMRLYPKLKSYVGACPLERRTAIKIINSELRTQYDIRKVHLLKIILALVEGAPLIERRGSDIQLGVRLFWPIWEKLCKFLLSDESPSHSKYLPYPVYLKPDSSKYHSKDTFSQRPDIVFHVNNSLRVIDAKYYDIGQNAPGWGDVVKQLFYEKSFKAIGYASDIKNYFLFPRLENSSAPVEIDIRSDYDRQLLKETSIDEFADITCLYYDMAEACSRYIANSPDGNFRNSLLN